MAKSVVILSSVAAKNVDSLNKTGLCATDLQNGHVVVLGDKSAVAGKTDAYVVTLPATATLATANFYMVYEPPVPVVAGKYKGITDDPREFEIPANAPFSMFKPQKEDEVVISADGLAGDKASNTHVAPADGVGTLTWTDNISGVSLALLYEGDTFISIGGERVVAYKFRVVEA